MFKRLIIASFLLTSVGCSLLAQESDRGQYNSLDPQEFLSSRQLFDRPHPRQVALALFEENTRESEGRKSEAISIEYPTWELAIVTIAIVGLADDSLRGLRYRLEFQYNDSHWQLDWVGSQVQCREGRGHQNWGRDRCL
ncbi:MULTISPECIES: hypothetical protein [Spirulina sp. CCY15215]|uniref:hypothetical protein n=1 Tax=Spirulina sp. CCY15215 TaxID=2767591 RepID=UPI00194FCF16|nr:hypothetical protein [Spirulina major]